MFSWICPKCGAEVPPSYSECPNCSAQGETPAAPAAAPVPTPQPQYPQYAQPTPASEAAGSGALHMAPWLVTVLVAAGLVAVGGLVYYLTRSTPETAPGGQAEKAGAAVPAAGKRHPLAKYIEVTGIRITEDASQKAQVQFLVVNHSAADIADLGGAISLRPAGSKPEQAALASFSFKVPSIGPYESKEVKTTVHSNLRAYELPDWQFLQAQFDITSPPIAQ
jgi:hypothetical protein